MTVVCTLRAGFDSIVATMNQQFWARQTFKFTNYWNGF